MGTDAMIARLQTDVQYLLDRAAILDCISQHARGCDRHDSDLIGSAYHADSVDEHGTNTNPGPEYANWANTAHAATSRAHTHNITTHSCEIDGDTAHCESYVLVGLLQNDGRTVQLINGRYLDRLERRDGAWRIVVRRSTVEWTATGDASMLRSPVFTKQNFLKGTRARNDLSYQRPLSIDTPAPARW
ncbi:nuclear transport factor 2 family protein [Rhodococcus sp. DMU1]|uniref:nuclear transport factor 2 family protein n=1 Tax=Rhodococcus sp. DMU1 TaxID=2722825 RepID=UPI00143E401C|nr:nuclear transport factor 2 family protein [Rhodococcus sp. DMU1]QIX49058.1 nuclear transport factor 2 family protein [Rhodococcus sp. DMU1]